MAGSHPGYVTFSQSGATSVVVKIVNMEETFNKLLIVIDIPITKQNQPSANPLVPAQPKTLILDLLRVQRRFIIDGYLDGVSATKEAKWRNLRALIIRGQTVTLSWTADDGESESHDVNFEKVSINDKGSATGNSESDKLYVKISVVAGVNR